MEDCSQNDILIPNKESNSESENKSTEFIDKMTLELLMNKTQYKKYVSKTDPKKYQEIREHLKNVEKYKKDILGMTQDLLQNPEKQINTEINNIFDSYIKSLISYFKQKEIESINEYNKTDEDVMFKNMETDINMESNTNTNIDDYSERIPFDGYGKSSGTSSSYWGKEKIIRKPTSNTYYNMNMFSKTKF